MSLLFTPRDGVEAARERQRQRRAQSQPTMREYLESQAAKKKRRVKNKPFDPSNPLEHQEQATLIQWKFLYLRQIPELEMLIGIPNQGAARLKNLQHEGTLRGVYDLFLAVPRRKSHGLWLELKRVKKGKLSAEQIAFGARAQAYGYECVVARGAEEAWQAILKYLQVKDPR